MTLPQRTPTGSALPSLTPTERGPLDFVSTTVAAVMSQYPTVS